AACTLAAIGLCIAAFALPDTPWLFIGAFCLAGLGIAAALPTFWQLPTLYLSPVAAAGGIALINSVGNLAGYLATYGFGWLVGTTGHYRIPLQVTAAVMLAAGLLVLLPQITARR